MAVVTDCVNSSCHQLGLHLRLGVFPIYPVSIRVKRLRNGAVEMDGVWASLLNFVLASLNISYEFRMTKGSIKEQNYRQPNGTWTGFLGKLVAKEVDIFLGPDVIDEQRFEDFRLLEPTKYAVISVLASVGKSRESNFFSFLFKVQNSIWICLFLTFFSLVLFSGCDTNLDTTRSCSRGLLLQEIGRNFWTYLAALFSEGSPRTPPTRRSQVLLFLWLYSVLVFSSAICSQFTAAIMVKENDDFIRTVQDIAERPHLLPFLIRKTHYETVLSQSPFEHHKQLYARALKRANESLLGFSGYTSPSTYQRIKDGEAVFFTDAEATKCLLSFTCQTLKGNRRLYFIEETMFPHQFRFTVTKDFPEYLAEKMNKRLLWITEGGFKDKWYYKYIRNYWKCEVQKDVEDIHLGLKHLASVFYLLAACLTICAWVLVLEILHRKARFPEVLLVKVKIIKYGRWDLEVT